MRGLWELMPNDRVGLGWRPELAAGFFTLDQIDVLEVIADDYFDAPAHRQALGSLARRGSGSPRRRPGLAGAAG